MTTPRYAIGLSERLRDVEAAERRVAGDCDCRPEDTANWQYADTCREAAAALDALQARVKELEGELTDTQAALTGVNSDWAKAESRATSAEQERDEALERAAGVVDRAIAEFDDLLKREDVKSAPIAVECTRITMKALGELAAAIRRLAAGTEKESTNEQR